MRGTRGGTNNSNDSQVTFRMHAGVTTTGASSSSKREREKLQNFLCAFFWNHLLFIGVLDSYIDPKCGRHHRIYARNRASIESRPETRLHSEWSQTRRPFARAR